MDVLNRMRSTSDNNQIPTQDASRLHWGHRCGIVFIVSFAIVSQLWNFHEPYMRALETGFQELLARRHLDPGLSNTYGLSTLVHLGETPSYHATHPPLLPWSIALMYRLFGETEPAARLIPLASFFLVMLGVWLLLKTSVRPQARVLSLLLLVCMPISHISGRIVNFETPTLAAIVWTIVLVEWINQSEKKAYRYFAYGLSLAGALLDWPYHLFITCLFVLSWIRGDKTPQYQQAVKTMWAISMAVAVAYTAVIWSSGAMNDMITHAKNQSGAYVPEGFRIPPILYHAEWWSSLYQRLSRWTGAIYLIALLVWLIAVFSTGRHRKSIHHDCLVLTLFCMLYFGLFSRATFWHIWCFFYIIPLLVLTFTFVIDRLPWLLQPFLAGLAIWLSSETVIDYHSKTPLRNSYQVGRILHAAIQGTPFERAGRLDKPLLYVNRVDPLPYYAQYDTAYSHMSVEVALPSKFLIRHRPEFVVLTGMRLQSEVASLPEFTPNFFEQLRKSYTRVYADANMEVWESTWSPLVSLMGCLKNRAGEPLPSEIVDDTVDLHFGVRMPAQETELAIDLASFHEYARPGKRWLHGWCIALSSLGDEITATVKNENGKEIGRIDLVPQQNNLRWQEWWVYLGPQPERLTLSWNKGRVIWGDLRLVSETVWQSDLTQVLASEIERLNNHPKYNPVAKVNKEFDAVLHHPGFGVDSIMLPPIRVGYDKQLKLTYGLSPAIYDQTDGVTFRVYLRDHALGTNDLILDEFLNPAENVHDREWKSNIVSLAPHARHVLTFTFEVDGGPSGNTVSDHAIWREAILMDRD